MKKYELTINDDGSFELTEKNPVTDSKPMDVKSYADAVQLLDARYVLGAMGEIYLASRNEIRKVSPELHSSEESCKDTLKYIQRKLIAEAFGARPFIFGEVNYFTYRNSNFWLVGIERHTHYEGVNYFGNNEAAEDYLKACQNNNLL